MIKNQTLIISLIGKRIINIFPYPAHPEILLRLRLFGSVSRAYKRQLG